MERTLELESDYYEIDSLIKKIELIKIPLEKKVIFEKIKK
jgi:hypothetical protein